MKLRPLGKNILMTCEKESVKETDGILIPGTAHDSPIEFLVIDVGPKVENITEGEKVLLPKSGAIEIKCKDATYWIVHEDSVLAVFE